MNTYLLTWNPINSPGDEPFLLQQALRVARGMPDECRWSAGNNQGIKRDDRVFLLRQGSQNPGMIGSGRVVRDSYWDDHRDPEKKRVGKKSLFIRCRWNVLVPDRELPRSELLKDILPSSLLKVACSGAAIPSDFCNRLEARWRTHLGSIALPPTWPNTVIPRPTLVANVEPIVANESNPTSTEGYRAVTDDYFEQRDAQRRRIGQLAQEIALQSEQLRLRELGYPHPEQAVTAVWNEPSRGYDILSSEMDGNKRLIEVKAARVSVNKLCFFLSRNEWEKSRASSNYWFYLVLDADSNQPQVLTIPAIRLLPECLTAIDYSASVRILP